jgi:hypothetical protein
MRRFSKRSFIAGAVYVLGLFLYFGLQFVHTVKYAMIDPEQRVAAAIGVKLPKPSQGPVPRL